MKVNKHVTVGGLKWAVLSANERTVTHAGRHFMAVRCRPGRPWHVHEHDCDISQTGSAKPLLVFSSDYEIDQLSQAVKLICEGSPLHPSVPFEQHRAAMQARRAAHNEGKV